MQTPSTTVTYAATIIPITIIIPAKVAPPTDAVGPASTTTSVIIIPPYENAASTGNIAPPAAMVLVSTIAPIGVVKYAIVEVTSVIARRRGFPNQHILLLFPYSGRKNC
mmetsp:Transcript_14782/g.32693  ORF Transcript_14782/g.32693 Transcript_14782/m.32693 type:complete len:109 (+) Transcript_14782:1183-1509(+)